MRACRRGLTLAEVLVVLSLLGVLSLMVVQIYTQSLKAQAQAEKKSGHYRAAVITVERLRQSLRGARVVAAEPGRLLYQVPQDEDGRLLVDASGSPVFGHLEEILVSDQGVVTVQTPEGERHLAALGAEGSVDFGLNGKLLQVAVTVSNGTTPYLVETTFHLGNQ